MGYDSWNLTDSDMLALSRYCLLGLTSISMQGQEGGGDDGLRQAVKAQVSKAVRKDLPSIGKPPAITRASRSGEGLSDGYPMEMFKYGLCIPSACSKEDVGIGLFHLFQALHMYNLTKVGKAGQRYGREF